MGNKPVRFHPEAEQEYLETIAWYRQRSRTAAANFETAVSQAITRIGEAPQIWPIYFQKFRRYILRRFPFSVVYEEVLTEIVVFAVAHSSRRPGYWRRRT